MKIKFKNKIMDKKPSFGFEKKNFGSPKDVGILAPIGKRPAYTWYGDYDGDGVINGLDCDPHNARKQGEMHTSIGRVIESKPRSAPVQQITPIMGRVIEGKPAPLTQQQQCTAIQMPKGSYTAIQGRIAMPAKQTLRAIQITPEIRSMLDARQFQKEQQRQTLNRAIPLTPEIRERFRLMEMKKNRAYPLTPEIIEGLRSGKIVRGQRS